MLSAIGQIDAGQIRPLAITWKRRYAPTPRIPTLNESWVLGFESGGWFGLVAPAGTPPDRMPTLNAAFVGALNDPKVGKRIQVLGADPDPMTSAQFGAFSNQEIEKWSKVADAEPGGK